MIVDAQPIQVDGFLMRQGWTVSHERHPITGLRICFIAPGATFAEGHEGPNVFWSRAAALSHAIVNCA